VPSRPLSCRSGSGVDLRRFEPAAIVTAVLLLVALPIALQGRPFTPRAVLFVGLLLAGGIALAWWRTRPRAASSASLAFLLGSALVGGPFPDSALVLFAGAFAVLGLAWRGRAAWAAAGAGAAYLVVLAAATGMGDVVPALMFSVPPFAAGTVLRLRLETTGRLEAAAQELEQERELYAEIVLRHERARIAGELHDVVGHAISVMVIQAAAGRRLVGTDPAAAAAALGAIAESAREGRQDLGRLVELLGRGTEQRGGEQLALVEEVARRADRAGLQVRCRIDGDPSSVPDRVARLAFRVVQESLTNALRYAPGAEVRIAVATEVAGALRVRIENDRGPGSPATGLGSGRGIAGLQDRVDRLGGRFTARATATGGWEVEALLPWHRARLP
jgi:signal transduction histidine kinase